MAPKKVVWRNCQNETARRNSMERDRAGRRQNGMDLGGMDLGDMDGNGIDRNRHQVEIRPMARRVGAPNESRGSSASQTTGAYLDVAQSVTTSGGRYLEAVEYL